MALDRKVLRGAVYTAQNIVETHIPGICTNGYEVCSESPKNTKRQLPTSHCLFSLLKYLLLNHHTTE